MNTTIYFLNDLASSGRNRTNGVVETKINFKVKINFKIFNNRRIGLGNSSFYFFYSGLVCIFFPKSQYHS